MNGLRLSLLVVILCHPVMLQAAPEATVAYALVVTNNRSLTLSRPNLHYADDDGIKYAQLFSEKFGRQRVVLLTRPDPSTRRLFPGWTAAAISPTRVQLDEAVERLGHAIAAEKSEGKAVQLYLVFAGHGDVDRGQGFIELLDSRLTARDLETGVIAKLKADTVHLILDSCNSFFMLNPRGKTVRRWSVATPAEGSLLEKYPHVGVLISTSAEAVTYEWSELQSGIFSYEVRSALRGGADADGQSGISYAEVAAFVDVASERITNELYRPKIFARGPGGNRHALLLSGEFESGHQLNLDAEKPRRLTVRDQNGVRVLDVHQEQGTVVNLNLPRMDTALTVHETVSGRGDRPANEVRVVDTQTAGSSNYDQLSAQYSTISTRGEAPVFRNLFASAFGRNAFRAHVERYRPHAKQVFGVSRADVTRLEAHLELAAALERQRRLLLGRLMVSSGLVIGMVGGYLMVDGQAPSGADWGMVGLGALGLGYGLTKLLLPSDLEKLHRTYLSLDQSTPESRAAALARTERSWQLEIEQTCRRNRLKSRLLISLSGAVLLGSAVYLSTAHTFVDNSDELKYHYFFSGAYGVFGAFSLAVGIWSLFQTSTLEKSWKLYNRQGRDQNFQLGVAVAPTPNGMGLSLYGRF